MSNGANDLEKLALKKGTINLDERVQQVSFTEDAFLVHFADGRILIVPIRWYPRLLATTPDQRTRWCVSEDGYSIIWPDIDEQISTEELLWIGPDRHEANRALEEDARALAAEEAQNTEALDWIEAFVADGIPEDDDERRTKAIAWAEEILRRYTQ